MKFLLIAVTLLLSACGTGQQESSETKQLSPTTVCWGKHLCQSADSIGHSCKNHGMFSDANAGYFGLKNDDCCGHTEYGGNSIEFSVTSCSLW